MEIRDASARRGADVGGEWTASRHRQALPKRCQMRLRTDGAGPVVVTSVANDWRTAPDNALARGVRLLMRLWRRGNDSRRMRQCLIGDDR